MEEDQHLVFEKLLPTEVDQFGNQVNANDRVNLFTNFESGLFFLGDDDQSLSSNGETLSCVTQKSLHYDNGSTSSEYILKVII